MTDQIVGMIADFGRQHAQHYRSAVLQVDSAKELAALSDTTESAMDWEFKNLNGDSVRLWIAAKLRVACLSEAVNEEVLWDSNSSMYDELLDSKMPFSAYQWFNRHMSFSQYEADDETAEKDRFRKRRMVLDVINALLPLTYNPHQDVGVDEKVRSHKHRGKRRIREKASVHSGAINDSLNDCSTGYCLRFEEALAHGANGGKCALADCAIAFPKKPALRCNACDKFYHNGCFWRCHAAAEIGEEAVAVMKKHKSE